MITTIIILYVVVAVMWGGWKAYQNQSINPKQTVVNILEGLFISGAVWPISIISDGIKSLTASSPVASEVVNVVSSVATTVAKDTTATTAAVTNIAKKI